MFKGKKDVAAGEVAVKEPKVFFKKKKRKGVEQLKSRYGRLFVLPWELGLVMFFFIPIVTSIRYAFSEVSLVVGEGYKMKWVGLHWFDYYLNQDANYVKKLTASITSFGVQIPIILALSLILAIILNQKFYGRFIARAIFFLPVIIATGVIIQHMTAEWMTVSLVASSGTEGNYNSMIDFNAILGNLGLPEEINKLISGYIGDIFNLLWSCGIQIVLFIAGLQTIPDQLYEVSRVEGASKWEEFWYITIPMLGPTILLVMVYTMIDLFTQNTGVMASAFSLMKSAVYDRSSAMMWMYFVVVGAIMAVVLGLYNKLCLKKWS